MERVESLIPENPLLKCESVAVFSFLDSLCSSSIDPRSRFARAPENMNLDLF